MDRTLKDVFILAIGLVACLSLSFVVMLHQRPLRDCDTSSGIIEYDNCVIPVTNLLQTPELYHGKTVYVSGMFNFGIEDLYISTSEDALRKVWVDFPFEELQERHWTGRSTGVLRGVFHSGRSGHYGYFHGELTDVVIIREEKL